MREKSNLAILPVFPLDDGAGSIPLLLYTMLNECLALLLLESCSDYLRENGSGHNLISLLDEGEGHTWRVLSTPDAENW